MPSPDGPHEWAIPAARLAREVFPSSQTGRPTIPSLKAGGTGRKLRPECVLAPSALGGRLILFPDRTPRVRRLRTGVGGDPTPPRTEEGGARNLEALGPTAGAEGQGDLPPSQEGEGAVLAERRAWSLSGKGGGASARGRTIPRATLKGEGGGLHAFRTPREGSCRSPRKGLRKMLPSRFSATG